MSEAFRRFANWTAHHAGRAASFVVALMLIVAWGVSGPLFGWSDTWQLVINTGTTIVTFLMVFLIQNTQNRDTEAIHLKLDELLKATRSRRSLIDVEDAPEETMAAMHKEFARERKP